MNRKIATQPYDIVRTGEDADPVTLAVAGFNPAQIGVSAAPERADGFRFAHRRRTRTPNYLYRGIAARSFERRFNLADFVEVAGATFKDGLLHIDLVRRVPEAMKPRRIDIGVKKIAEAVGDPGKTIDHVKAA